MRKLVLVTAFLTANLSSAATTDAWQTESIRPEIAPAFRVEPSGGPNGGNAWVIASDHRPGLVGRWVRTFPIEGGRHYAFHALRRVTNTDGRRTAVARILWLDEKGKPDRKSTRLNSSHT